MGLNVGVMGWNDLCVHCVCVGRRREGGREEVREIKRNSLIDSLVVVSYIYCV